MQGKPMIAECWISIERIEGDAFKVHGLRFGEPAVLVERTTAPIQDAARALLEQGVTTRPLLVARSHGAPTLWCQSIGIDYAASS
jgi:hypothetical protein